jgi:DMSO/TMAO reductase YedYZ molybdopterin-dependent catalytic subunit
MTSPFDRRRFLGAAGLAAASALWRPGPARGDGTTTTTTTTTATTTATTTTAASGGSGLIELSSRPMNYESTLDVFTTRLTPVDRFYIRGHFDTPVVDLTTWRLTIDGLVDAPQALSLAALEGLPQHEVEAVLQCAGNGRALMQPRVAGVQWTKGAMGNARWRGPRLKDVLALARPKAAATMVQLVGADGPVMPSTPRFIRGVPVAKALDDDTLVALQMNGRPLTPAHGAPARLVMPGWVADGWTKWAQTLTLMDGEPRGFFWETAYRFPTIPAVPGAPVPPENMKPMTTLRVKSVIGAPTTGAVHRPGPVTITGVAFSGGEKIARVEVSVDGGPWQRAPIVDNGGRYGFAVFSVAVTLRPGTHTVRSRATDARGAVQPEVPEWNPSGYLHNAIDSVTVEVRA